jgi:hypothetical protein
VTPRRTIAVLAAAGLLLSGCGSTAGGSAGSPGSTVSASVTPGGPAANSGSGGTSAGTGGGTGTGGGSANSNAPGGSAPGGSAPGGGAPGGGGNSATVAAAPVDACPLLKAEEVADVIGPNDGGRAGSSACTWTGAAAAKVSIAVGQPNTAAGSLPPWDPARGPEKPLPNTMRSLGAGQVEFIANNRDCTAQVVTATGGPGDEQRAVDLATILQERL